MLRPGFLPEFLWALHAAEHAGLRELGRVRLARPRRPVQVRSRAGMVTVLPASDFVRRGARNPLAPLARAPRTFPKDRQRDVETAHPDGLFTTKQDRVPPSVRGGRVRPMGRYRSLLLAVACPTAAESLRYGQPPHQEKAMSILVRFTAAPGTTAEKYDATQPLIEEAAGEWPPDGLEYHVAFSTGNDFGSVRSGTRRSSSRHSVRS